ncbi:MAG: TrbI/VirB10 family protein [Rhodospirillales bacterium]
MSSAFCDLALALGLTIGGMCADPPARDRHALPPDDTTAWSIPAAPPPPLPAPPPPMPPVVIKREIVVEKPIPMPAPTPAPKEQKPDPVWTALKDAWATPASYKAGWDTPALEVAPAPSAPSAASAAPPLETPEMEPLALSANGTEKDQYESPGSTSTRPVDNQRILAADRYITGIIETGINSQVGGDEEGSIVIQTARDVYGYHGRKVLVPKGSRLICTYAPPKDMGSSRLEMKCDRILLAGHRAEIRDLGAPVGDAQGRQGVAGEVDRRFWERYGTAIMLTSLSTAVRFAAATSSTDGADTTTAAAEKAAEELSNRFGEITASVLEETLSLVPIITIPQGTRVQIRPATDWYIADWHKA